MLRSLLMFSASHMILAGSYPFSVSKMAMGAFVVVGDGERVELRLRFCGSLSVRRLGVGELVPMVIFRVTLRVRRLAEGQAGPELACGRIELAGPPGLSSVSRCGLSSLSRAGV